MNFMHFLQYNNAVPIAFSVLFLGATASFAATNPEAIYSESESVVSVDNTYVANVDLSTFTPRIQIESVSEDAENYYVSYVFTTIDVAESVWQTLEKRNVLEVEKNVLGTSGDLGLYATKQFNQLIGHETERLLQSQEAARAAPSQKIVATAYSGLVGKFLDDTAEVLPGYTPVVTPPEPDLSNNVAVIPASPQVAGVSTVSSASDTSAPSIQILGANPARVPVGGIYADLGVVVTDNSGAFTLKMILNGGEVATIALETKEPGTSIIRYEARDSAGNLAVAERRVIVELAGSLAPSLQIGSTTPTLTPTITPTLPSASTTPAEPAAAPTPAPTASSTPQVEPEPTPEPEPEPVVPATP